MDSTSLGLATRCHICYVRRGIYKCPRCLRRTCSVKCVQVHKKRSRCDGVRDETEAKALSWLLTPAGINHDSSFLSKIDRSIDRDNRRDVERGLFTEYELKGYDDVEEERDYRGNITRPVQKDIRKRLYLLDVTVRRVPRGMKRARENKTAFMRARQKAIQWQVEWLLEGVTEHPALRGKKLPSMETRVLHKTPDWLPLFRALEKSLEWYRRGLLTEGERKQELKLGQMHPGQKRRDRSRAPNRCKPWNQEHHEAPGHGTTQNTKTSMWNTGEYLQQDPLSGCWNHEVGSPLANMFDFYLHIPQALPIPKNVIMPVRSTENLINVLRGRTVIEFPTIYVFPANSTVPGCSYKVEYVERTSPFAKRQNEQSPAENEEMQKEPAQDKESQTNNESELGDDGVVSTTSSSSITPSDEYTSDDSGETRISAAAGIPDETRLIFDDRKRKFHGKHRCRAHGRGRGGQFGRGGRVRRGVSHTAMPKYEEDNAPESKVFGRDKNNTGALRGNLGNSRGSYRGQRGRRRGGHYTLIHGGRGKPVPGRSCVKRTSGARAEDGDIDTAASREAPPAKKHKASATGLVSYDSDSDDALDEF